MRRKRTHWLLAGNRSFAYLDNSLADPLQLWLRKCDVEMLRARYDRGRFIYNGVWLWSKKPLDSSNRRPIGDVNRQDSRWQAMTLYSRVLICVGSKLRAPSLDSTKA